MSSNRKKISIHGVTGSVGQSTVDVILSNPDKFDVACVSAHRNVTALVEVARSLKADKAIIVDESLFGELDQALKDDDIEVQAGARALEESASESVDLIVAAIMGFAGVRPILRALEAGINVAIANKEPLVAAGDLIMQAASRSGARILPVDSEHNAIFQVFEEENRDAIDRIVLTASGGPFLNRSAEDVYKATPEEAVSHPNWSMGKKISVDSATMMNKALEVIEAHYLFGFPADKIDVVIHPQSVVHSMVAYKDGSVLSQMGASDMRIPIASALAWPDRLSKGGEQLAICSLSELSFMKPDMESFPALEYAYKCLESGQVACVAMNAANEVAVAQFLSGKIFFGNIVECVAYAVDCLYPAFADTSLSIIDEIEAFDNFVRERILEFIDTDLRKQKSA